MEVQRPPVDGTTDTQLRQVANEAAAIDGQPPQAQLDWVQVPRMDTVVDIDRQFDLFNVSERVEVTVCDSLSREAHLFSAHELVESDGCCDIGEVVLEAWSDDLIVPRAVSRIAAPRISGKTVKRHHPHALGQTVVVGHDHAAFAGRDRLVRVEGKTGRGRCSAAARPPRIRRSPAPRRREAMRGILDDPETKPRGKGLDRLDIHHQPANMDRHDADKRQIRRQPAHRPAGSQLFDLSLRIVQVEHQGVGIAVDEDRRRILVTHDLGGRGECHRRNEHAVASRGADSFEREVERCGAGVDRERVARVHRCLERLLKLVNLGTGCEPA